MASEDDEKDLELKDLIIQTLDSNGILSKLKAQIRANVFVALDENERNNENNRFINSDNQILKNVLKTKEGRLTINLVREFLEACNMRYTLSVFDPELNINDENLVENRQELSKTLNLSSKLNTYPLLCTLVKSKLDHSSKKNEVEKIETLSSARSTSTVQDAENLEDFSN